MLNALFPISFPIQDQVILMDDTNFDLMNMIKRLLKTKEYVYLNIGKTSTVIQVIWLNTISSNPTYYQLYQKIKKYYKMIFNYIDENITDTSIQPIVDSSDDDSTKLQKIKTYLNTRFIVSSGIVNTLPDKNLCILFFLLFNNDEQKLYNQFIQKFVKQFVINDTTISRYGISDQYYRTEFFNYLKKLFLKLKYMKHILKKLLNIYRQNVHQHIRIFEIY